jgi:hypothetical protein
MTKTQIEILHREMKDKLLLCNNDQEIKTCITTYTEEMENLAREISKERPLTDKEKSLTGLMV